MTKFVAFLRGINVGGHRKIPMSDLRRICTAKTSDLNPRTYIASGNLLFEANEDASILAATIADGISEAFGFKVPVLVLPESAMRGVLECCPFPLDAGKQAHAFLCFDDPNLNHEGISALRAVTEHIAVVGRTVWLFAPDGIGQSRLAYKLDRLIGTEATARNLNTLIKMVEMLDQV